jgi:N-acetylmuramoyl-L-alanine amidase
MIIDSSDYRATQEIFKNFAVITDDGHGWFTPGKRSFTNPPFYENEFNSILEAKLMFLMDLYGLSYAQLSPGAMDTELSNRKSVEHYYVNEFKTSNKQSLGISLHCDAFSNPKKPNAQNEANGFCVYYISEEGKKLARCIADSIIINEKVKWGLTPRHDHGIEKADFYVLRETLGTWVLIENGFMTNDKELTTLKNDNFRNTRALSIFKGLYNYVSNV